MHAEATSLYSALKNTLLVHGMLNMASSTNEDVVKHLHTKIAPLDRSGDRAKVFGCIVMMLSIVHVYLDAFL